MCKLCGEINVFKLGVFYQWQRKMDAAGFTYRYVGSIGSRGYSILLYALRIVAQCVALLVG